MAQPELVPIRLETENWEYHTYTTAVLLTPPTLYNTLIAPRRLPLCFFPPTNP
jgi:hypothetical protein